MTSPKTSLETCMVEFQNTDHKFYTMEKRPIYNTSNGYFNPESCSADFNIVTTWYADKVVRQYNNEGIIKTWYYRPTVQDVFDGYCGTGCCVKFNSDGSIYMNWGSFTWYYGPLIDGEYEEAYEGYDSDDEPCDRCRSWRCECGYGGGMWN